MWFYGGLLVSNAWNVANYVFYQCRRTLEQVLRDILVMHSLPEDSQELNGYVVSSQGCQSWEKQHYTNPVFQQQLHSVQFKASVC